MKIHNTGTLISFPQGNGREKWIILSSVISGHDFRAVWNSVRALVLDDSMTSDVRAFKEIQQYIESTSPCTMSEESYIIAVPDSETTVRYRWIPMSGVRKLHSEDMSIFNNDEEEDEYDGFWYRLIKPWEVKLALAILLALYVLIPTMECIQFYIIPQLIPAFHYIVQTMPMTLNFLR